MVTPTVGGACGAACVGSIGGTDATGVLIFNLLRHNDMT